MWPLSSKMALAEGLGQVTWTLQLISSSVNGDNNSYLACFLELLRGWSVIRNMKLCWNLWSARYARYIVHGGYCSKHKYTCHERLSWFPNSFSGCFPTLFAEQWPESYYLSITALFTTPISTKLPSTQARTSNEDSEMPFHTKPLVQTKDEIPH